MFFKKVTMFLCAMSLTLFSLVANAVDYSSLTGGNTQKYIVLLEEQEVLSDINADSGYLMGEFDANLIRNNIYNQQTEVKSQIASILPSAVLFSEDSFSGLSFTDVLNGFVIEVTESQAKEIRAIDGVKSVVKDEIVYISKPDSLPFSDGDAGAYIDGSSKNSQTNFSVLNHGSVMGVEAMYEKGYTGEGRVIAILDTEIDYNHEFLSLSNPGSVKFTKNDIENIILEKSLNIDMGVDEVYHNSKIPFAYNYESKSGNVEIPVVHGSHVSGIAAGNSFYVDDGSENGGVIRGVAPEAQIIFFGVFKDDGSAYASTIIAALDDAVKFGADSINMSFGTSCLSENYVDGVAALQRQAIINAEKAGCAVVCAAGNDGRGRALSTCDVDCSTGDNRFSSDVAFVGSVQSGHVYSVYLEDENGQTYFCDNFGLQTPFSFTEIIFCDDITSDAFDSLDLTDKIAVVKLHDSIEKTYTIKEAFQKPRDAGAAAVVVINNANQITNTSGVFDFPAFFMPKNIGEELVENASGVKYDAVRKITKVCDEPTKSYFTSCAYTDDLTISVDFAAPGGNILSSVPGGYANMSGTSMAAPQITGAMTLMHDFIQDAYPDCSTDNKSSFIRSLLSSTAETVYEENGALSSPRAVGSGIIKLDKAMQTGAILLAEDSDDNSISLGDGLDDSFTVNFRVKNISNSSIVFDSMAAYLSTDDYKYYDSLDVYGYSGTKALNFVTEGFESVTVGPGKDVILSVDFVIDDADIEYLNKVMVNGFFVDGKITLSSSVSDNCDIGIPFVGFYGDWNSQPIIAEEDVLDVMSLYFVGNAIAGTVVKKVDDEYVMYLSEKPDDAFTNASIHLRSLLKRNAYVQIFINDEPVDVFVDGKPADRGFVNKNYEFYTGLDIALNEIVQHIKDGDCVVRFEFTLPYHKEADVSQSVEIKIIIDNKKPTISRLKLQMGQRSIVKIDATDDVSVSSIFCFGYGSDNRRVMAYNLFDSTSATFMVETTGFRGLDFVAYDSALNSKGIYSSVEILKENGELIIRNNSGKDVEGFLVIAEYDEAGKLVRTHMPLGQSYTFPLFEDMSCDISTIKNNTFKVFLFKSENSLSPLCPSFEN